MDAARVRVFVSSVIEGFSEYREAARRAITSVGFEPVLVNEDFPSLPTSPRNACLDAVRSSDICIALVGKRLGWTAPSGKLVVEEEIESASGWKRPVLLFVERGITEAGAVNLADRLSNYVDGQFRLEFGSPEELEEQIVKSLRPHIPKPVRIVRDFSVFDKALAEVRRDPAQAEIRLVVVPERDEEIIDPARLESPEFLELVYEVGHSPAIRLFDYEFSKEASLAGSTLRVEQRTSSRASHQVKDVTLQIGESGELTLDINVTGRNSGGTHTRNFDVGALAVAEEDIEALLKTGFRFVGAVFDRLDPYKRHERFYYNAGLIGLGYRTLTRGGLERRSSAMGLSRGTVLVAYDQPRVILRTDLVEPSAEIQRALTLIGRRVTS